MSERFKTEMMKIMVHSKFIHDHSRLTQVESGKVQGMNRKEIERVAVYKIRAENAMVITSL